MSPVSMRVAHSDWWASRKVVSMMCKGFTYRLLFSKLHGLA